MVREISVEEAIEEFRYRAAPLVVTSNRAGLKKLYAQLAASSSIRVTLIRSTHC